MKFAYVITYVQNVDETLSFYEKAFGFQRKFITPEKDYGELVSGETTISFASLELAKSNFSKPVETLGSSTNVIGVEFAFTSEDIENDFSRAIDAGAKLFEPIKLKPWGQKVGYLLDLNGFLIEVCTPIG
ncbi:MAG: VOC family protein [Crocinitomicaceae bacterium]